MFSIRFYRIYDIGKKIDLNRLERTLSATHAASRASFLRVKQKSIMMEAPPILLRLAPTTIKKGGHEFTLTTLARIYEIGAISLCLVLEEAIATPMSIEETALFFAGQDGLEEAFVSQLTGIREHLKPQLGEIPVDPGFFEDYTIYLTDQVDAVPDPAVLLIGERANFSTQTREEVLKYKLSYSTDDLAVITWDSALLCDREKTLDLVDLIEFANVQVLELRYYDRELSRLMERMYEDIGSADTLPRFSRIRRYHRIMVHLMESTSEISEIAEKVNNLIKITEDVYYARVYATTLKVLRSSLWSESVDRKIEVVRQNYAMLSDEVNIQHSNFLEWVIIVLIALEFGLAIWQSLN
jgi:hypothetical protein